MLRSGNNVRAFNELRLLDNLRIDSYTINKGKNFIFARYLSNWEDTMKFLGRSGVSLFFFVVFLLFILIGCSDDDDSPAGPSGSWE